jgi:anti-sigma B factor antagonist
MEIAEQKKGSVVVLALTGRLDAGTAGKLEEKLVSLIDAGNRSFVLDLMNLDYISSAGLRVLLMTAKKLKGLNGRIVLASLKDHIREVFDIAGFSAIFPTYDQQDAAVGSFQ